MHNLLIITLLLPALCLAQSQNPNFAQWKMAVGKKYGGNSEESYRAAIFNKNVQQIKSHNSNPFRSY